MSDLGDWFYVRKSKEDRGILRDRELEQQINTVMKPRLLSLATSTSRPTSGLYRGKTIFETDTGNVLVYYGATTGWQKPWNRPWGVIDAVITENQAAFGIGGSGVATPANTNTLVNLSNSVTLRSDRKYRLTATVNVYSPAGATNALLSILDPSLATICKAEHIPSTTIGHFINIVYAPYTPASTTTGQWRTGIEFAGATGFVLQDSSSKRFSNFVIEDMGPTGSAPAS